MLAEFEREISPFKFSSVACGQGFKFCRFLREALPRSASFKILMFGFFYGATLRSNFKFTPFADSRFSVRFKFNRKVEILKRQNLDFARH